MVSVEWPVLGPPNKPEDTRDETPSDRVTETVGWNGALVTYLTGEGGTSVVSRDTVEGVGTGSLAETKKTMAC